MTETDPIGHFNIEVTQAADLRRRYRVLSGMTGVPMRKLAAEALTSYVNRRLDEYNISL